jgi:hypothetical protein
MSRPQAMLVAGQPCSQQPEASQAHPDRSAQMTWMMPSQRGQDALTVSNWFYRSLMEGGGV